VPVITPFELELGLGARAWSSMYLTSCTSSYAAPATTEEQEQGQAEQEEGQGGMLEAFATRLQRVQEARANRSDGSDSDSSSDEEPDEAYEQYASTFNQPAEDMSQALALLSVQQQEGGASSSDSSSNSNNKLVAFESPAAAYLAGREFQGMAAATEEGASTKIEQGQFGIAAGYEALHE
jgi:hypothetical protein